MINIPNIIKYIVQMFPEYGIKCRVKLNKYISDYSRCQKDKRSYVEPFSTFVRGFVNKLCWCEFKQGRSVILDSLSSLNMWPFYCVM